MRACLIFSLLAVWLQAAPAASCSLKMAMEAWPPYVTGSAAKPGGLDVELAQAILKEAGCTLQVLPELPALRRQMLFQQGKLDLMLAASQNSERRGYARFSAPYRQESIGLFSTPAKAARYRKLDSFGAIAAERITLLAPKAGWYGEDYARAELALEATSSRSTFGSLEQGVTMFKAGRGELIMGDTAALRHEAQRQGVALAALPYVPYHAPVHLMLNADSTTEAELARINAAIARLEQNGTLAAIRARYGAR